MAVYHRDILDHTPITLETKMGDYSNRIRHLINRNRKYVIALKVDKSFRLGQNLYEVRLLDDGPD